jgi:hypothetical protein
MKTIIKSLAPWLAATAVGAAIALAPTAGADTNPQLPYHVDNHDEANTTNGFRDVPF